MKPLHLNLASRPYRDYRPVYAVVVLTSLLIAFLTLNNFDTWFRYKKDTQSTRSKIESIDAEAEKERKRADAVTAQLRGLDLVRLNTQTHFINTKLAQRTFSWSELLDRLEHVVGDDVRLVSITPQFAETGDVKLLLRFEAKNPNGMIETIDKMNADPQFANPFPSSQVADNGIYLFGLSADFKPSVVRKAVIR